MIRTLQKDVVKCMEIAIGGAVILTETLVAIGVVVVASL